MPCSAMFSVSRRVALSYVVGEAMAEARSYGVAVDARGGA